SERGPGEPVSVESSETPADDFVEERFVSIATPPRSELQPRGIPAGRKKYVPAVGPRLKKLLVVIFAAFAILTVNSVYLVSISLLEWTTKMTYQNYFYQYMFLLHLAVGLAIVLPVVLFGIFHIRNARNR